MLTTSMAVATSSSHAVNARIAVAATRGFGVGRGFAVLVVIFALMFAVMVLGGHLRAASRRKRSQKLP